MNQSIVLEVSRSQRVTRLRLIGLSAFITLAAWTLLSGLSRSSATAAVVILASAGSFLAAERLARSRRWLPPLGIVIFALAASLFSIRDVFVKDPLSGPFGYANSKASLFVLATIASLMLAKSGHVAAVRYMGILSAVLFALVTFLSGSMAGKVLLLIIPLAWLAAYGERATRFLIKLCSGVLVIALVGTLLLAAGNEDPLREDGVAAAALSERRIILWGEALQIMLEHPGNGVGAGRFSSFSDTAQADQDASWAHHEFLQHGAETGIPGFIVLIALFFWGFTVLHANPRGDLVTALAAIALLAVGIHSCIDYMLHFPAIPLITAALLGTGAAQTDLV